MIPLNKQIENVFTEYFKDESKIELLKKQEYELLSNELTDKLFSDINLVKNKQGKEYLKSLFKEQFIPILKKYEQTLRSEN